MAYRSKVECDACGIESVAPADGGFPFGWCEINVKPSQRGPAVHKRTRLHLCAKCTSEHLGWIVARAENAA